MSTNGDDPAGIQREKQDVKPRMTQSRLGSLAASSNYARQTSAAGSSQRAASTVLSQRPVTSTPSTAPIANQNRQPLFRPRDTQSPEAGARAPIKLDDEEDDDSLWAELDAADPSFTQEALRIDEEPEAAEPDVDADINFDTTELSVLDDTTVEGAAPGVPPAARTERERGGPDVIDMSLDDDTEDSVYLSGRSKRPRKVSPTY